MKPEKEFTVIGKVGWAGGDGDGGDGIAAAGRVAELSVTTKYLREVRHSGVCALYLVAAALPTTPLHAPRFLFIIVTTSSCLQDL